MVFNFYQLYVKLHVFSYGILQIIFTVKAIKQMEYNKQLKECLVHTYTIQHMFLL